MTEIPNGVTPPYHTEAINPVISLYEGELRLSQNDLQVCTEGSIVLTWASGATVRFKMKPERSSGILRPGSATLTIPEFDVSAPAIITRLTQHLPVDIPTVDIAGTVSPMEIGGGPVSEIRFLVVNFPPYVGNPVTRGPESEDYARLTFIHERWKIDLDVLPGVRSLPHRLNDISGFAVMHTGQLSRLDSAPFQTGDAEKVLHGLFLFLSFAAGDWSPVLLPVGVDSSGKKVWQRWAAPISRPWTGRFSWFSPHHALQLPSAFSSFLTFLLAPQPGDALDHLVRLYVAANGHVQIEPRIVLAQAALELLAWLHAVQNDGQPTDDPEPLLSASIGHSPTIPKELPHLAAYAKRQGWSDGPRTISEMRNGLVHPGSRPKLFNSTSSVRVETWQLAMYFLEVGILYWLGYEGEILNRLRARTVWDAEAPPWSS